MAEKILFCLGEKGVEEMRDHFSQHTALFFAPEQNTHEYINSMGAS